ncbi:hypothetical protein ElyMa_000962500 [Elysia marginata]|uniref:Uncharacterized protein n=1 Tax=Elysia marginata TaxID=1093978 RepID=A0AAV4HDF3_9GAST|nr:hypothetical protein ElyMa_000962500 [Elysia marginata]
MRLARLSAWLRDAEEEEKEEGDELGGQQPKPFENFLVYRMHGAHHKETRRCVEARARALFRQWTDTSVDGFEGVTLWELDELEDVFKEDIDVFEFKYDLRVSSSIDEAFINTEMYCIYFSCTVAIFVVFQILTRPFMHLVATSVASNTKKRNS